MSKHMLLDNRLLNNKQVASTRELKYLKQSIFFIKPAKSSHQSQELISQPPLQVFLCHSSNDKPKVRELYRELSEKGISPWFDEENILPGQEWEFVIQMAVRESDIVIVCLSQDSVSKEGYIQKEIRFALDIADEKPEGRVFIIPIRLEECEVPSRLRRWQYLDLFNKDGFSKLFLSLEKHRKAI